MYYICYRYNMTKLWVKINGAGPIVELMKYSKTVIRDLHSRELHTEHIELG